jgi:hypothetical protein
MGIAHHIRCVIDLIFHDQSGVIYHKGVYEHALILFACEQAFTDFLAVEIYPVALFHIIVEFFCQAFDS